MKGLVVSPSIWRAVLLDLTPGIRQIRVFLAPAIITCGPKLLASLFTSSAGRSPLLMGAASARLPGKARTHMHQARLALKGRSGPAHARSQHTLARFRGNCLESPSKQFLSSP